MGTSIHCFFARGTEPGPADLQDALNPLMAVHREDVQILAARGRFSGGWGNDWHLHSVGPDNGEPAYIFGEGPAGLGIWVYPRVVNVSSAERFFALYDEGLGVALALRRILCSLAHRLGASSRIAVAAAGFGDTDKAADVAYYEGGSFEDLCATLMEVAGPPARTWAELARGPSRWYLGEAQAHP